MCDIMEISKEYIEMSKILNRMMIGFNDEIPLSEYRTKIDEMLKERKIKFSEYDKLIGKLKVIETITIY